MAIAIKKYLSYTPLLIIVLLILDLALHVLIPKKVYYFKEAEEKSGDVIAAGLSGTHNSFINLSMVNNAIQKETTIWFDVFSTQKFDTITIKSLTVSFDKKNVKITKKFILKDCEPKYVHYENKKNIGIYKMSYYGEAYMINFVRIFKSKRMRKGEEFDVKITVNYLLDDWEYTQDLNYVLKCAEEEQYPPVWYMMLFPGAY